MARLRLIFCLAACIAASFAHALPEFWDTFREHYKPAADSAIAKGACVTCHTAKGQTSRNPYGLQIERLVDESGKKTLTEQILLEVEPLDANGNDVTNGEEIKQGSLPGAVPAKGAEAPAPAEELVPKHSFHPAVVHFPLALFIFGALLDFWAWRKRRPDLRAGALVALLVGAYSSLIAIPTGVAAWLRIGFALEGNMLIHLLLAVVASLIMIGVAMWRRKGELESNAYWLALGLGAILIGAAGHFGAAMVYS